MSVNRGYFNGIKRKQTENLIAGLVILAIIGLILLVKYWVTGAV